MNDRKQSVDIMTHHFKQSRDVLTQSAAWTSYGDLTIKPSGYQEITTLVKQHHLFNPPAYDDFVEPSLYKGGITFMTRLTINKIILPIITFIIFLGIWEMVIIIGHYQPVLLPGPALCRKKYMDFIVTGEIFQHLAISLWRFVAGFVVALLVAIPLGFLLGRNRWLYNAIEPLFQLIRPISPIAWAPFVVLWFGIGSLPAIAIIFIAAFFPIVFNTIKGVRDIEPQYLKNSGKFKFNWVVIVSQYIISRAFKQIMAGIHMAVGTSWIFLVSGEMIGAQSGLGFLIVDARNMLNLEDVLAAIFFIGLFGFIIDRFISYIEQFILRRFGE